eukprot:COSAG01_NODE_33826_length_557_cov_1058.137555_1_plen_21_part_10
MSVARGALDALVQLLPAAERL